MKRDWTEAHAKIADACCRVCGNVPVDPAHIVPRSRIPGPEAMLPQNVVPLCRADHRRYDQGGLDLLPYLTLEEQECAAGLVGLVEAMRYTTGRRAA